MPGFKVISLFYAASALPIGGVVVVIILNGFLVQPLKTPNLTFERDCREAARVSPST